MVISQSTITGFYIASVGQIMMIALALFFLHRKHPFRFTSVVVGIGVYFLASQLLTSICYSALSSIPAVQEYLNNPDNAIFYYLMLAVLTALFMSPVAFVVFKFVRKGSWNVYEAVAGGISYWIYSGVTSTMNYINQAKIADMANKGDLSSLLSEQITQADIDAYIEVLKQASLGQCLAQLVFFASMIAMSVLIFILIYHGMKRQKLQFVFFGIGIHFTVLFTSYMATLAPLWVYCVCIVVLGLLMGAGIYLYFRWYRRQQLLLLQQRKEFKARKQQEYQEKIAAKAKEGQAAPPTAPVPSLPEEEELAEDSLEE